MIIVPQAYAGYATEVARETADEVFVEPSPSAILPSQEPEPDPSPRARRALAVAASPSASPSPTPVPVDPRITGVIVGVDAGVGRNTYGTDTMIVVSMDPATETVSMISVPRDMVDVPLADGRKYRGKINGLVSYVRHHPRQFPKNDGTGFDVLMGALGKLLGIKIDYYAAVTLGGFVQVVNTLGGVDVNVARAFCDPRYLEYGFTRGFSITAGKHHLNGNQALAYARVRKAAGESDFTRAARQQEVLSGIRDRVVKGGFVNDPIGLLRAVGKTVTTNVPRKLLPDLADAAAKIGRDGTYRAVISHPLVGSGNDTRGSIQIPNLKKIRALADALFPTDGSLPKKTYAVPKGSTKAANGSGVSGCGRAAPRATPRPTPKPTKKPTPKPTAKPTTRRRRRRPPNRPRPPRRREAPPPTASGWPQRGCDAPVRSGEWPRWTPRRTIRRVMPFPSTIAGPRARSRGRASAASLIVLAIAVALATGLAATASAAAPKLPACKVADTLTKQRSLGQWQRSILDSALRLGSGYKPDRPAEHLDRRAQQRAVRPEPRGRRPGRAGEGGSRRRRPARRPVRRIEAMRPRSRRSRTGSASTATPTRSRRAPARGTASTSSGPRSTSAPTAARSRGTGRTGERASRASGWRPNAWKYGFIMSYPKGKTTLTCYMYEPWHYRYVGKDVAAKVRASGLTLREYLWRQQEWTGAHAHADAHADPDPDTDPDPDASAGGLGPVASGS